MTKFARRLLGHLTYANLIASLALFAALGGVGYAATTINGNAIKKQTIGAGKLKKGTLSSTQVKPDGLTGAVILEASLGTVPSAQTAATAATATRATSADRATAADSATSAATATSADRAATADRATTADTATTADHATTADTATSAESAATLDGISAADLELSCPANTTAFGGMCWNNQVQPALTWIGASIQCGKAGGRLPSLSELVAYLAEDGDQVEDQNWSADLVELNGGTATVATSDESDRESTEATPTTTLGYRCLFYRTN